MADKEKKVVTDRTPDEVPLEENMTTIMVYAPTSLTAEFDAIVEKQLGPRNRSKAIALLMGLVNSHVITLTGGSAIIAATKEKKKIS